ncbi:glycosyltransferase family A protein [Chthonobacter rhizosphaerae]|uniref:glycosyltransferase family A protein n=1 Tax=Chthonobacter rhizosphaerae TaxID=2735553 RepID=UPI0015EEB0AC|nr:glycosyltransferase family 2 protein [Chthonobacter rhizosphaerae]
MSPSSEPLVVFVTPVYNGADFIEETLACVQAQTYRNIVHVVIDNGSTDGTRAIIERYVGREIPVIAHYHDETIPQIDNFIRGVDAVPEGADFFRILCADDTVHPTYTERCIALARQDPEIVLVGTGATVEGMVDGRQVKEIHPTHWPKDRSIFTGPEATRMVLRGDGVIIGPHLLVRTSVLKTMPGYYRRFAHGFDTDAAFRVLTLGKFGFLQDELCLVRVQESSVSHLEMHPRRTHFIDWMLFLKTFGEAVFEPAEYKALLKAYRRYYLRRLVLWTMESRKATVLKLHLSELARFNAAPRVLDWVDAALDLPLRRLSLRRKVRSGHPLG